MEIVSHATLLDLSETALDRAIEGLVFASDTPMTFAVFADVVARSTGMQTVPDETALTAAVERINIRYASMGSALRIEKWAGGYRMATIPEVAPFLRTLFATRTIQKLSRSVMETLSVVAYKQPVTKPEIDFIRGVNSDYALRRLLETGFVEVAGRSDAVGHPLLYTTTTFFLEQFGLADLSGLPQLREVEELLKDPAFEMEREELIKLEKIEAHEAKQPQLHAIQEPSIR
ncbi:MAG TPA: SMC-Scp complex subunit ScpB [Rhodothermales bacterium]|nr:SMC-Scp complex subunit ScpB [Rhodothermales bacterium]